MKSIINLSETKFEFHRAVASIEARLTLWHKGSLVSLPDFGTVLCDWDALDPRWQDNVSDTLKLDTVPGPIFRIPGAWKMSHVLKALGAFPSVGDAARNGWGIEVGEGVSFNVVRINKVKGVLVTFRPPPFILQDCSWELCEKWVDTQ